MVGIEVRHAWRRAGEAMERGGGVEWKILKGSKGTKATRSSTHTQTNKHGNSGDNGTEDGKATKQDGRTAVRAGKTDREAVTLAVDGGQQREAARQLGQGR